MSFLRPEAQAALYRFRDLIVAAGLVALGLYWGLTSFGILKWIGWLLVLAGAAFAWSGLQRIRFHSAGQGEGVVQVTEGQIAYLGPFKGGVVALTELREIVLDQSGFKAQWILRQLGQDPVLIPVDAEGADALFDVFAALPGLNTERMLSALRSTERQQIVIWQRAGVAENLVRLH